MRWLHLVLMHCEVCLLLLSYDWKVHRWEQGEVLCIGKPSS